MSLGAAPSCYGEESNKHDSSSTFLTRGAAFGMVFDLGPRVGLEYRWPGGPGVEAAIGTSTVMLMLDLFAGASSYLITGEALAILPLFKFGRSGALELAPGVPSIFRGNRLGPGVYVLAGGAPRLRFELGSRWIILLRVGAGYLFNVDPTGFHAGVDTDLKTSVGLDAQIGVAFRL